MPHGTWDLWVPRTGIKRVHSPVEVWSPNHWTAREFLKSKSLTFDSSANKVHLKTYFKNMWVYVCIFGDKDEEPEV